MTTHLLIASVPARRASLERLLVGVAAQTAVPKTVHLFLDGYANEPRPAVPEALHVEVYVTEKLSGPGARWDVLGGTCSEADVLVVLDDDQQLMSSAAIERLALGVTPAAFAAAQGGTDVAGWGGMHPAGTELVAMGAAAMAVCPRDLDGLHATRAEVREKCDFNPFGDGGDDEAVIALHLWRRHVKMQATGEIGIIEAPGTQTGSQFERRQMMRGHRSLFWQREAIRRVSGWPWTSVGG